VSTASREGRRSCSLPSRPHLGLLGREDPRPVLAGQPRVLARPPTAYLCVRLGPFRPARARPAWWRPCVRRQKACRPCPVPRIRVRWSWRPGYVVQRGVAPAPGELLSRWAAQSGVPCRAVGPLPSAGVSTSPPWSAMSKTLGANLASESPAKRPRTGVATRRLSPPAARNPPPGPTGGRGGLEPVPAYIITKNRPGPASRVSSSELGPRRGQPENPPLSHPGRRAA